MQSQNTVASTADRSPSSDALVAAGLIAAGTIGYTAAQAGAEPIRFDTDTPLRWSQGLLDITLPASMQETGRWDDAEGVDIYLYTQSYSSSRGADEFVEFAYSPIGAVSLSEPDLARGDTIDGSTPFARPGLSVDFTSWVYGPEYSGQFYTYDAFARFRSSLPLDGSTAYVGVRLSMDGGTHYGWIAVSLAYVYSRLGVERFQTQITAWGYETEAGVPIVAGVPGPAPLGVLAIGAAGALGRRRAKSQGAA